MQDSSLFTTTFSRRDALSVVGAAGLTAVLAGLFPGVALATPDDVKKFFASTLPGVAQPGKVTIGAPDIAENGNTVPITLSVDSPMTEQSYVKTIVMAADGNPLPGLAKFDLSPANGEANVQFRIRLAQTQNIYAIAQMNDGSLWSAQKLVKVTIGGCGG